MMNCPTCGVRYSNSERICPKDGAVLEPVQTREQQMLGTTLDGKYRLDSFISRGGMGAVFRGTHVMLDRPVAIKTIKPDLVSSPEVVRRFQREARAATQLNHPNIVHVYDLGQTSDGTLYIAMELVAGTSLKDVITSDGALDPKRIVDILGQVCDGLAVAHRAGIIHRDLKPQNIMLTRDRNGAELAKIVDFGIAKTFEIDAKTQLTADGTTLGTPQYMSPEQAAGTDVDPRSDIYALGVILYEMLTGEVPFQGDSVPAILVKHMSEPPMPPSQRRPDLQIPAGLESIALRCLAKDPGERYATTDELGQALRGFAVDPANVPTCLASAAVPAVDATVPRWRSMTSPPPLPPTPRSGGTVTPATHPTAPAPLASPPPPPAAATAPLNHRWRNALIVLAALFLLMASVAGLGYWTVIRPWMADDEVASEDDVQPPETSPASANATLPRQDPNTPTAASTGPTATPAAANRTAQPSAAAASSSAGGEANEPRQTTPGSTDVPGGTRDATPASTSDRRATGVEDQRTTPGTSSASTRTAVREQLPANPTVSFQCRGAAEICGPLRNAMQEAMEANSIRMTRSGGDIVMTADVTILEERADRQFGTTMLVRTYSIEMQGESPRFNEDVPMPGSRSFSADARLGAERFNENARLTAAGAVERVRAFWKSRTP